MRHKRLVQRWFPELMGSNERINRIKVAQVYRKRGNQDADCKQHSKSFAHNQADLGTHKFLLAM